MSASPPPAPAADPALIGKKILIVEDDAVITHVYVRQFKAAGCVVENATDGIMAMDVLGHFIPDVVVLDLQMPKVNGIGVLKFIRAKPETAKVPVIVFSNAYLGALVDAAWQAGATKCLSKAVTTPKQLLNAIKGTLAEAAAAALAAASPAPTPAPAAVPVPPSPVSQAPVVLESVTSVAPTVPVVPQPVPVVPAAGPIVAAPAVVVPAAVTHAAVAEAEISQTVLDKAPEIIQTMHAQLAALIVSDDAGNPTLDRGAKLMTFFELTRSLTGKAGLAGWRRIASLSSALEALLRELDEHAESVSRSTIHTLKGTIESLAELSAFVDKPEPEGENVASVLIVHANPAVRKTLTAGLDKHTMKGVAVDDGGMALNIAGKVDFKLIIAAADMTGISAHDFLKKLRDSPRHARTPIVFVTGVEGPKPPLALGKHDDWISTAFPAIELTVKTLAGLFKAQVNEPAKKPA